MSVEREPIAISEARTVPAVFGSARVLNDPTWEWDFAAHLRCSHSPSELLALYSRYRSEEGSFESQLRRVIFRAMCRTVGHALQVGPGIVMKHPETMELGDAVFIGAQTMIQGRYDGTCRIGNHVWIGPHAYFDARDLILEDYVGWGPGAKVLGSTHIGLPVDVPIIRTDLEIRPVLVQEGADVGTGAILLPGVRIGKGSIIGAGAVVTRDVPEFAIFAGVPARFVRWRNRAQFPQENE